MVCIHDKKAGSGERCGKESPDLNKIQYKELLVHSEWVRQAKQN